ncbi:MAG: hypothetical protein V8T51_01145 [Senegalimassilia faecalis]
MFTGIVEELGRIVRVPSPGRAGQLEIAATRVLTGTNVGDSIAVNGVCLPPPPFPPPDSPPTSCRKRLRTPTLARCAPAAP